MTAKLKAKTYTQEGKDAGSITLPESVFAVRWNADLVHSVVTAMRGNARNRTAHTKDRSEVRGGGRKPWRQKGTGRARHGSRRSPLWAGGGVTFGPRNERDFSQKINKKVRAKAFASVLSKKLSDGEIIFVDSVSFDDGPKTKAAKQVLESLSTAIGETSISGKKKNAALLALTARDKNVEKSFRNLSRVEVMQLKDVNPVELLTYKYIVITEPEDALKALEYRVTKKFETDSSKKA